MVFGELDSNIQPIVVMVVFGFLFPFVFVLWSFIFSWCFFFLCVVCCVFEFVVCSLALFCGFRVSLAW